MAEAVIEVRDATRTYRRGDVEVPALCGVDLEVARGEFVAIMGASGSGKSTLLNLLGCLDRPTRGHYRLEGIDVAGADEATLAHLRSRRIGFVFQSFNLLSRTSAAENVALPLFYSGQLAGRDERARASLRALGLSGREENHPSQLSGGQQQRVAIARALINEPALLLADEPTGNLDSATAIEILDTLSTLHREQGLTIVLVTHEREMAEYADRILTMRDGRIVSEERLREPTGAPAAGRAAPPPPRGSDPRFLVSLVAMALPVAARAIARNKLRAALTMLGIFIGVAALITMVAVGQGANAAVIAQIESLGANLLIVLPGATTAGGVRGGFGSASSLRLSDAEAIRREAPAVANVGWLIRAVAQAQYRERNWNTTVQGVSASYLEIQRWALAAGRRIDPEEQRAGARVCVIGQTVLQNLFGAHENPIGAEILVRGVPLRVVGVLAPLGQTGFGRDQDDVIVIPFSTAETKVLGVSAPTAVEASPSPYAGPPNPFGTPPRLTGFVNMIFVQARDLASVGAALAQTKEILARRHRVREGEVPDFDVRNLSQVTQAREGSSRVMALLLALVASISLVVGGIGIMNILLVSVTERTREIGIRMAIGARRAHVLLQFLVEAVLLSALGGLAGVIVGIALSEIVAWVAGWPILLSPLAAAGGFVFSAAVGIFFGYYPARRASLLDPIEALRYE